MIKNQIYNFLKTFSYLISEEHKNKLGSIQSHLEYTNNLKVNVNKFGEHYETCVWSNENTICGPDTCKCGNYRRQNIAAEEEAKQLIQFYYNIYNVTKCKHCNFNKNQNIK